MKQFVISRCRQAWGIEYSVTDFKTKETFLRTLHNGGLKNKINAYGSDSALKFTIQCRDLFGLGYDVVEAENIVVGVLDRENWLSPMWRVINTRSEQTAQIVKVSPSLYEEHSLDVDGQAVCLFRKADSFSDSLICCCLDESQVSLTLMLAAGILMLGQGLAALSGATA